MLAFLVVAVVGANGAAHPARTLAGVTLGATLASVSNDHADAQLRRNGAGSRLMWERPAGGTVIAIADNTGNIVKISFFADHGETGVIDLPCVGRFPIQDSHVNLDMAIDPKACVPIGSDKYRLRDGSILELLFGGPSDGQLGTAHWYKPNALETGWQKSKVAITAFECIHDPAAPPELSIDDLDGIFTEDLVIPHWMYEEPTWKATVGIPAGHYILRSFTKHCVGESEQLVTIPDHTRHVTMTLDRREEAASKMHIIRLDENMYATAVYGLLPSAAAQVELMSADSVIGEQTRQLGKVDGDIYEFDHVRPGRYVLRAKYGDIVVSREVGVPPKPYGTAVRADLSPEDASQIVQQQAVGSGYVALETNGLPLQTFQIGKTTIDGWTTQPLIKPADYSPLAQRISAPAAGALVATQHFLNTDSRIPKEFNDLSDWSAEIHGQGDQVILVYLFPNDSAGWQKVVPKTRDLCVSGIGLGEIVLRVDSSTFKIIETWICP